MESEYLESKDAIIDQDEYRETVRHIEQIAKEVNEYLTIYIDHINKTKLLNERESLKENINIVH